MTPVPPLAPPIKLLIVDDSALMRRKLREIFQQAGGFEVRTARNGADALERIPEFAPDVISLDIHMPAMDGLTCLSHIMVEHPTPVVMVSSLTEEGALATLEALELGAVDYLPKPGGTVSVHMETVADQLVAKVRAAARARVERWSGSRGGAPQRTTAKRAAPPPADAPAVERLLLIGVSTGGPKTLEKILPRLPADFPLPILVAQHMPASFTRVFAQRMDQRCVLPVTEVTGPTVLEAGHVYLAKGDADMVVRTRPRGISALPVPADPETVWHPSVDRLVESACDVLPPRRLLGVLLTGMGDDGAEAMSRIHTDGGRTIAEAEESAIVFGMPRELILRRGAEAVLPADRIADRLCQWVGC